MATAAQRKSRRKFPTSKVRKVLDHPFRVRIVEVLDNRPMSVSQFVDEGLIPQLANDSRPEAISIVSYHFRELRKANLIEIVERIPGRGREETIYRALMGVHHDDEEWASLPRATREGITPITLSSLTAIAENAVLYKTFDNRVDRHLAWVPMDLDEQGWSELSPVLNGLLEIALRVREEAKVRIAESGDVPIRTVLGAMMFETPPVFGKMEKTSSVDSPE